MISDLSEYIFSFFDDNKRSRNYFDKIENYPNKFYYLSLLKNSDPYSEIPWHIHGLWPQYNNNSYPSFCRQVKFDINELRTILPDMEKYWYSTENPDTQFWEHEWEKHGSCMFNGMDEFEYFNTALKLYTSALKLDLPDKYYNQSTEKCLIPVTVDFKFFN